eukprot:5008021-Pleurochrysis_carterae.AAC.1
MVEGYENCRAYGPMRGVVDEETAREHVRLMTRTRTRPPTTQSHSVAARVEAATTFNAALPRRAPSP